MAARLNVATIGDSSPGEPKVLPTGLDKSLVFEFLEKLRKALGPRGRLVVFGGFVRSMLSGTPTDDLDIVVGPEKWNTIVTMLVEFGGAEGKVPEYSRLIGGSEVRVASLVLPGGLKVDILDHLPVQSLDFEVNSLIMDDDGIRTRMHGTRMWKIMKQMYTMTTESCCPVNEIVGCGVEGRIDACHFLTRVVKMAKKGWKLKNVPEVRHTSMCDDCAICGGITDESTPLSNHHVMMECGTDGEPHHFCIHCLTRWMSERGPGNSRCPLCRTDIQFVIVPLLEPSMVCSPCETDHTKMDHTVGPKPRGADGAAAAAGGGGGDEEVECCS